MQTFPVGASFRKNRTGEVLTVRSGSDFWQEGRHLREVGCVLWPCNKVYVCTNKAGKERNVYEDEIGRLFTTVGAASV